MMLRKYATGSLSKAADGTGTALAVFSRFGGPPDADGDITEPGAFVEGTVVPVSPWNHTSLGGELPAGRGTIHVYTDRAECEVEFFLDTAAGRETYATLKALGRCEWSYGYSVLKSRAGSWEKRPARILEQLDVFELSPVIRGAGRSTETLHVRSSTDVHAIRDRLRDHDDARREFARYVRATHLGG